MVFWLGPNMTLERHKIVTPLYAFYALWPQMSVHNSAVRQSGESVQCSPSHLSSLISHLPSPSLFLLAVQLLCTHTYIRSIWVCMLGICCRFYTLLTYIIESINMLQCLYEEYIFIDISGSKCQASNIQIPCMSACSERSFDLFTNLYNLIEICWSGPRFYEKSVQ